MVVMRAGNFIMGSNEDYYEQPPHKVTIRQPFAVSKFEVTFDEWNACVAHGGCGREPNDQSWGGGRRPVINVSWEDAKRYVAWIVKHTGKPYRLLSEAEWEYAARWHHNSLFLGQRLGHWQRQLPRLRRRAVQADGARGFVQSECIWALRLAR